jgi:hypothetical protein
MLVFGGLDSSINVLNDVWSLSLSDPPTWTQLLPSGSPPAARRNCTAIYDPVRDRVLIYGGRALSGPAFNDLWSLQLTSTPSWQRITPKNAPTGGRYAHSAIYEPIGDRMIVFSGGFATNDVWSFSPVDTAWVQLTPSGTPPLPRSGHTAIYDPLGQRMVVFGGNTGNLPLDDTWALSLAGVSQWSLVSTSGDAPTRRGSHSAVYDPLYQRMAVFGGTPDVSEPTWALRLAPPVRWSPFRPVNQSAAEVRLQTVTVGDTMPGSFTIWNAGMLPLQVSSLQLPPAQEIGVGPPAPFELAWGDSMVETLSFVASVPGHLQDSVVIVSNDPFTPRSRVNLDVTTRGLEFDTRVLGSPAEAPLGEALDVVVTPRENVRIEGGTLHYRTTGGGGVADSLPLTALATDFIAVIPASAVTERGVEYYVQVRNSGYAEPPTAPAAYLPQAVAPPSSMTALPRPTSGTDFLLGRDIEVEMALPPGSEFVSGTIHYRQGGEPSFGSDTLSVSDLTGRPVATIPGSIAGPYGVEYWVEVQTLRSTLRYPAAAPAFSTIRIKVQNLVEPSVHAGVRYRLLAVPIDFGVDFAGSLDALLTDQLGTYDPVRWRAYTYDPGVPGNIEFSSAAPSPLFRPEPGRAFWLISRVAHRVDTHPIDGFSTPTAGEYPIVLEPGWNLFGNPFDFPVAWTSVRPSPSFGKPVAFDPSRGSIGDYADSSPPVLEPFEGYFILSTAHDTMWVSPNAVTGSAAQSDRPPVRALAPVPIPPKVSGSAWRLRLRVTSDVAVDGANEFGVDAASEDGLDPLDLPKPPAPPGPWVRVAFPHPEWASAPSLYRRDLRRPGAEGQTWEIEVRSSTPGEPVTLDLSDIVAASPGLALRLIDRELGSSVVASQGADESSAEHRLRYTIVSFGPRPYRLAIVAGTSAYVSNALDQALSVPARVTVDQNAPNPFQFATRIRFGLPRAAPVTAEIYSVLGQRVATLADRTPFAPGYHSVVWDGSLPGGGAAPSGVYLLRLTTDGDALTTRMILVR